MNRQDIEKKLKDIIVDKLDVDEQEVTPEADYREDLGADSLDVVELLMETEKEFNISITDEEAEQATTVGKTLDLLERRLNA